MANSKNSGQGATAAPQQEAPKTRGGTTTGKTEWFSAGSVAHLVRSFEEDGTRLFALLSSIRAMWPRDERGDFEDLSIAALVDMAQEITGDVSHLAPFKTALREAAL
jgi:hypothetical protein